MNCETQNERQVETKQRITTLTQNMSKLHKNKRKHKERTLFTRRVLPLLCLIHFCAVPVDRNHVMRA